MKTAARIAISRVLSDLIKADSVIDLDEMMAYANLKEKYAIDQRCERQSLSMPLACALSELENEKHEIKANVLKECISISKSDGFCEVSEARLLLAIEYCLSDNNVDADVISIPEQSVKLEFGQIIYVEGRKSEKVNESIIEDYRSIVNELHSIGLDFVYIPYIASHYSSCNANEFSQVVSFLAPNLSDEEKSDLISHLSQMTTTQFCKEQLCHRLGMVSLADSPPSFLLKISNSYVDNQLQGDYLRFSIGEDALLSARNFVDRYKDLLSAGKLIVSNVEESQGKFLYYGFYKQLFDMYTIRKGVECSIEINPYKGEIRFVEINQVVEGLKRKEKAFYLWLLLMMREGGVSFAAPQTQRQLQAYKERMEKSMILFEHVYELFGGTRDSAPDITLQNIRGPIVSNIRSKIKKFENELHNIDDYQILKDDNGIFRIGLDLGLVKVLYRNEIRSIDNLDW